MEFDLIHRYFHQLGTTHDNILCGVGDDCALLKTDKTLAISTDTLNCGVHFLENDPPDLLGWKSLAVNVSDLAASGAKPLAALLALSLPQIDEKWLSLFQKGFDSCAKHYNIALIGGDTTRGALSINITILGETKKPLLRCAAQANDDIWLSHETGWASIGLDLKCNGQSPAHLLPQTLQQKAFWALHKPIAHVELALQLSHLANSAIDVSDGLIGDLTHLSKQSHLSAHLFLEKFPKTLMNALPCHFSYCLNKMFAGGEDYVLLFSASPLHRQKIEQLNAWRIGVFQQKENNEDVFLWNEKKENLLNQFDFKGFEHF